MTTGHIQIMREFVAATPAWHKALISKEMCPRCGVIPDRMMQLTDAIEAFLAAYDAKKKTT